MGGLQIENLLNLMEGTQPFDTKKARREVVSYINDHMSDVAKELKQQGEAVIRTSSGSFRLTEADLITAE